MNHFFNRWSQSFIANLEILDNILTEASSLSVLRRFRCVDEDCLDVIENLSMR